MKILSVVNYPFKVLSKKKKSWDLLRVIILNFYLFFYNFIIYRII